jgi:hypothetical protein
LWGKIVVIEKLDLDAQRHTASPKTANLSRKALEVSGSSIDRAPLRGVGRAVPLGPSPALGERAIDALFY